MLQCGIDELAQHLRGLRQNQLQISLIFGTAFLAGYLNWTTSHAQISQAMAEWPTTIDQYRDLVHQLFCWLLYNQLEVGSLAGSPTSTSSAHTSLQSTTQEG
jgi:hypothetical protein